MSRATLLLANPVLAIMACDLPAHVTRAEQLTWCEIIGPCEDVWNDLDGSAVDSYAERAHGSSSTGGGVSQTEGLSAAPAVTRDGSGAPVVAWHDDTGGAVHVRVKTWRTDEWVELGSAPDGASATLGQSTYPSLAVLGDGSPVVAWQDDTSGDPQIYVKYWNGAAWSPLGGNAEGMVTDATGSAILPKLAAGSNGELYLVWADETSGSSEVYLLAWDGSVWSQLGGSAQGAGLSSTTVAAKRPCVAVNSQGQPVVAWENDNEVDTVVIYLRVWKPNPPSPGQWLPIGSSDTTGVSTGTTNARSPAVVIDPSSDAIVVAWQDADSIGAARWTSTAWVPMPAPIVDAAATNLGPPSLGLWHAGTINAVPLLAWHGQPSGAPAQVYAVAWNATNSAWQSLATTAGPSPGLVTAVSGSSLYPIWSAPQGQSAPLLAWQDNSTSRDAVSIGARSAEIFLEELHERLEPLGTDTLAGLPHEASGVSLNPTITFSTSGPVVAWQEVLTGATAGAATVHLLSHDAVAGWHPLSVSSRVSPADDSAHVSPHIAPEADPPTLTWTRVAPNGDSDIYLAQWNGSAWQELGGSMTGEGISNDDRSAADFPAVAVDREGRPYVAWADFDAADVLQVYVAHWSGAQWQALDGAGSDPVVSRSSHGADTPTLALDSAGAPTVAWSECTVPDADGCALYQIYAKRWVAGGWIELGGSASGLGVSATSGLSLFPALALDAAAQPAVAWTEWTTTGRFTFLRRWSASAAAWQELGGSASGTGVGGILAPRAPIPIAAHVPALTVDGLDRIWVAWTDATSGTYEIYLERWSGTAWHEVGASATGGGVSNSSAPSIRPALAARGHRGCVAWSEGVGQQPAIAVRCTRQEP
jgi:hypothetical protein